MNLCKRHGRLLRIDGPQMAFHNPIPWGWFRWVDAHLPRYPGPPSDNDRSVNRANPHLSKATLKFCSYSFFMHNFKIVFSVKKPDEPAFERVWCGLLRNIPPADPGRKSAEPLGKWRYQTGGMCMSTYWYRCALTPQKYGKPPKKNR